MTIKEILKAAAVTLALLVLNVLIATLVIVFYALVIDPGHPSEYYDKAALEIAPWCSYTEGTALFFGAGYLFSRRRTRDKALIFAVAFTVLYAIIDGATVAFAGSFSLVFLASMLAKLAAALLGALLATRKSTPANQ